MALSFVSASAVEGATITIPGTYQGGDLIIMYAYRNALTAPSQPAGWNALTNASAGATSFRVGYKFAGSASETSGTWTNATGLMCYVIRGAATNKVPLASLAASTATTATVNYIAMTLKNLQSSWLVAFGAIHTTTATLETPPTGLVNQVNLVGVADEYSIHHSNGIRTTPWTLQAVGVTTSAEWRSFVVEVEAEQLAPINNYQFIKVGDGMSVSEKIF